MLKPDDVKQCLDCDEYSDSFLDNFGRDREAPLLSGKPFQIILVRRLLIY